MRFEATTFAILLALVLGVSEASQHDSPKTDLAKNDGIHFTFHFKKEGINESIANVAKPLCLPPHCQNGFGNRKYINVIPFVYAFILVVYILIAFDLAMLRLCPRYYPFGTALPEPETPKSNPSSA